VGRNTRRMVERLDPFSLPQPVADRLVLSPAPKIQKNQDARPDPSGRPRQRGAKVPRRK
jgi:hypothetical protein